MREELMVGSDRTFSFQPRQKSQKKASFTSPVGHWLLCSFSDWFSLWIAAKPSSHFDMNYQLIFLTADASRRDGAKRSKEIRCDS